MELNATPDCGSAFYRLSTSQTSDMLKDEGRSVQPVRAKMVRRQKIREERVIREKI